MNKRILEPANQVEKSMTITKAKVKPSLAANKRINPNHKWLKQSKS